MQKFSGKKTLSLAQLDALAALAERAAAKGGGNAKPSFRRGRFVRVENPMPFDVRKAVGEGCEYFGGSVFVGKKEIVVGVKNSWNRIVGASGAAGQLYCIRLSADAASASVIVGTDNSASCYPIAAVLAVAEGVTDIYKLHHGNLYLEEVFPCNFNVPETPDNAGTIESIEWHNAEAQVDAGAVKLPTANSIDCAGEMLGRTGGISSFSVSVSAAQIIPTSTLTDGKITLTLPQYIRDVKTVDCINEAVKEGDVLVLPRGISDVRVVDCIDEPIVKDGVLMLPPQDSKEVLGLVDSSGASRPWSSIGTTPVALLTYYTGCNVNTMYVRNQSGYLQFSVSTE